MRRLFVLLLLGAGFGALAVVACGGNEKPPLTPDTVEAPTVDGPEAGADPTAPLPAK